MKFILIEVVERAITAPMFFATYNEAHNEMTARVRRIFDDQDIAFWGKGETNYAKEGDAGILQMAAYGKKDGRHYDWKIFEL